MGPSVIKISSDAELLIRDFAPGDEADFRKLNEEWITRYFAMESKDEEALADPRRSILNPGGRLFFAVVNGQAVGCCALMVHGPGEFEVAKMAVTESCQGMGVGRRLLETAIAAARAAGASRLYLETNRKLGPAIGLYESLGFRHLPPEVIASPSPYQRCDVYMELLLSGAV